MLLDLRVVEDPPFGAWEDFFDQNFDGIDDRILRTIPTTGFATDAAWFRASSGRTSRSVADADLARIRSRPTMIPRSSCPAPGPASSPWTSRRRSIRWEAFPTPRARSRPRGARSTWRCAVEAPRRRSPSRTEAEASRSMGFPSRRARRRRSRSCRAGRSPLPAWGTPYARDVAWIPNTGDSAYAAVAAGAGGVQIVRAPRRGAPSLVLVQQSAGPDRPGRRLDRHARRGAGRRGVALLRAPAAADLNQIGPAAPPPYTAPVVLSRVQSWGASGGLERALHLNWATSATALRFRDDAGSIPDLMVSDGTRLLVLRPGTAAITGVAVAEHSPPAAPARASHRIRRGAAYGSRRRARRCSRPAPSRAR